jgi:hypothetical protein
MKRPVAVAVAAGAAAIVLAAGVLMPRHRRRAHTYGLLDSLAAVPLGTPLDSLRRAFPWLYCPAMTHNPAEHTPVCAADADGRDVTVDMPDHRVGMIKVMVFGRDMTDVVAWAEGRLGAPRGRCSLDHTPLAWWSMSGTTVALTEPPPGGRARELVIRAGGRAPPGCAPEAPLHTEPPG